jgi:hypothetical protein
MSENTPWRGAGIGCDRDRGVDIRLRNELWLGPRMLEGTMQLTEGLEAFLEEIQQESGTLQRRWADAGGAD